jgi:hypothetical protein
LYEISAVVSREISVKREFFLFESKVKDDVDVKKLYRFRRGGCEEGGSG